jgi:hypothetical protein
VIRRAEAVLQAEMRTRSSMSESSTKQPGPQAVWRIKTSSSRTDSCTRTEVSPFENFPIVVGVMFIPSLHWVKYQHSIEHE